MISLWLLAFSCTSIVTTKVPTNDLGENFYHNFGGFDDSLWFMADQRILCLGMQCFYAKAQNLEYDSIKDDKPYHGFLSIKLRNDCRGEKCCLTNGDKRYCTMYTGGQLTSLKIYGYGSYRFLGQADGVLDYDSTLDARYCFGLLGQGRAKDVLKITFCRFIGYPGATIAWQVGDKIDVQEIELPYNVGMVLSIMRIDWAPNVVKFFIKGTLIGFFDHKEKFIPNRPMRIFINVIPGDMFLPLSNSTERVEMEANVYRFRYIKWQYNTELFIQTNSSYSQIIHLLLVVFMTMFGILLVYFAKYKWLEASRKCDGHYKVLQAI